ncbi:MAG: class I tRNA ligase family protein [Candidatus Taylorbacteria bacterium]|nr:class I tRNA ligase family protein [Candidatus Taylorbacteria bacterium]
MEKEEKSPHALREERILKFWQEKGIFGKSLEKNKNSGKEFVFYEGPPTANGRPGIHHMEARAFKDAIPRYKTMRGFNMRRKGGWDTHGLPVELQVEKELGFKSKKDIENFGIAAFNEKCKASVWTYMHEWEEFTNRMGYWVDLKDPYVTYYPKYIESLWNIIKTVEDRGLLYKDYKVVPWCPRCGTGLSSHELAQGYADVKDLAVTVKFKLKPGQKIGTAVSESVASRYTIYGITWTTTPWTLPGNVGLAVGENIDYVQIKLSSGPSESLILAKTRLSVIKDPYEIEREFKGKDLVGLEYEPLYPFLRDNISGAEKDKLKNAYKIYAADFVTTEDGTGVVHTAVMYGQDDFVLGTKVGLPKYHLVNEDGTFRKEAGFLAGLPVKDENTDVAIIKDLAARGLLFHKEKHEHSYPFCWRCKTPLIYFARDSWYIRMSDLRKDLIKENESIHWEPEHIRDGRFGEWLREVKDWAISRERYWGTPLPVWICEKCGKKKVVGSIADVSKKPCNTYYVMRHGEAENNVKEVLNSQDKDIHHLTNKGKEQVQKAMKTLAGMHIDVIYTSSFARARETAAMLEKSLGCPRIQVIEDDRLHEFEVGGEWEGKNVEEFGKEFPWSERFKKVPNGGELYGAVKKRVGDFLYDMEKSYEGKTILVITHATPAMMLLAAARGFDNARSLQSEMESYIGNAEVRKVDFSILPHNSEYELDLHKPYIDEVKLECACGGVMSRVKEVMDVWFDSGAMPFAQDHYPFEIGKKGLFGFSGKQKLAYPADFISEAIDQTRGWFYTLHAIGVLMGKGKAFKNVICLGHILDPEGKKMSKSIGNVVDPWKAMNKYGADALRFWMYSINQPGESKNFDVKTVDDVIRKVFNLAANVTTFYKTYAIDEVKASGGSTNVLDMWIVARLNELVLNVTSNLDKYVLLEPTRAIRDFVADLSQWYLRRSRDRFKNEGKDKLEALQTTKYVILTLSKIMAPFTPFFAEELYGEVGEEKESVHLEDWPALGNVDKNIIADMELVRKVSSLGLDARMTAKINVRQPLQKLIVKDEKVKKLSSELLGLIRDEVNVKEIVFDSAQAQEVSLDLNISAELKEEGELRELLRKIQDLRKEKGLSIKDQAVLVATNDLRSLITKYEKNIKSSTNLSAIEFGETLGLKGL